MRPLRLLLPCALACLVATAALAQVDYQPTPPPRTAATDRAWYRNGDPIPFAGGLYYPAGPNVYFNANTMVPTGDYDGVTLYADTTTEPYSVVFVPIGDKLLRPYEPQRPDTRVGRAGNEDYAPTEQAAPRGRGPRRFARQPMPAGPSAGPGSRSAEAGEVLVQSVRKPDDNLGLWLSFQGFRWTSAGDAVPLDRSRLASVGTYFGVPVFADSRTPYVIYVPSRANLVAPFRRSSE